jgi:hypothetical protein
VPSPNQTSASQGGTRLVVIIALAVLLFGVVVYVVGSSWLNHFVSSGDLRRKIGQKTGVKLEADAGYLPPAWRGLSVRSGGLLVQGKPPRELDRILVTDIRASCSLSELIQRKWVIEELRADHLQAAFGEAAGKLIKDDLPEKPELQPRIDVPTIVKVVIRETHIARSDSFWGKTEKAVDYLKGVETKFYPRERAIDLSGSGGVLRQTSWPEFQVSNLAHYEKPKLSIQAADFTLEDGTLHAAGEVAPYLTGRWSGKAEGTFDGEAKITRTGQEGKIEATGALLRTDGVVHGWATLDGRGGHAQGRISAPKAD